MSRLFRIAIDGPAASGKSTTAKRLAQKLGFGYIDSGAMYRAVTLKCLEQGVNPHDPTTKDTVSAVASKACIRFPALGQVEMDGRDVSESIRTSDIVRHINPVASNPAVRETLAEQQRAMAQGKVDGGSWPGFSWRQAERVQGVVMDGRDIGTVILPDAELKVFIVADPLVRAQRRFAELKHKDTTESIQDIARDLAARDEADRTRLTSPLKKAEDAEELDTSQCTIDEQVKRIETMVHDRIDQFLSLKV